jgi:hypothetical protein
VVECFLAKEDVAGSTPVSRSKKALSAVHFTYNSAGCTNSNSPPEARYPSGKGEVCKTFMRRFDPDPRLQNLLKNLERLIKADFLPWHPIRQPTNIYALINQPRGQLRGPKIPELPTQRLCRDVCRCIENMCVDLRRISGRECPRRSNAALRGHTCLHHLCRSPVPGETPCAGSAGSALAASAVQVG